MGSGYCVLSTTAVVTLAILLLLLTHLSLKEYTEEIERLRRDVQAARDKNGVYLASENYTEMILRLENQDQEITSKLSHIKALTEEMGKKEELCQQLNISLEKCTQELECTTRVLDETRTTLTQTETKLKETEQECDEQQHLVEHHVATEGKLGQHARQLLTVADQSSTDTYKLHDKLDRKRSVENSNAQISRDFHRAFQQKLIHMEENVGLFNQEQRKFMSDLQSTFASHFEKGSSGLSHISEQMSSLVSNLNQLIQDFQKQTSDQAFNSQQWVQEHLNTARKRLDSQEGSLHQFQTELMPVLQALSRQLQIIQTDLQDHKRNVMQEFPYMVDMIVEHEEKTTTRLSQLRETCIQLTQQHQVNMEQSQVIVSNLKQAKEAQSDSVLDALTKIMESIKSDRVTNSQMLTELSSIQTQTIENSKQLSETVTDSLQREIKHVNELRTNYETHSDELRSGLLNAIEHSSASLVDAHRFHNDVERGINAVFLNSEQTLKEDYGWVETDLRKHSESISGQLRAQQDSVQELLSIVHSSADLHETALESQRAELSSFVRNGNDLDSHCSYISDWCHQTTVELRQRDQDLEKFLTEDLRRDVPTGGTPQRRDFIYDRDLVATSPHERILQRFRERRQRELAEQVAKETESKSEVLISVDEAELTSSGSDDSDIQITGVLLTKAASTNDLLNGDKIDLDTSFVSEPGSIKKENKENNNNLFARPLTTKKHHRSNGGLSKKSSLSTSDIKVASRRVLSVQNQH